MIKLENDLDRLSGARWYVLNPTAKNMINGEFLDPPIFLGINKGEVTKERLSVFETYFDGLTLEENKIVGEIDGVPVIILFVSDDYDFLKNLQTVKYENEYYLIPNPFEEYDKIWTQVK